MKTKKIINDPVYGFISIPKGIIYDVIQHPHFQRLTRIKQLGLTYFVYPGAMHTRFNHVLGAFHLMQQAISVLKAKGVEITYEEEEATLLAILLHDIGHGPFSHALEHTIMPLHHEAISLLFSEELNITFNGKLDLAIQIFKNEHPKKYLHQLISGQVDMDRMDYLTRDSFFTGVHEGVIGYDRIIKMLNIYNGELVVEEKGIYSIDKFLIARNIMYWQVYLHKTAIAAEQMLIKTLERVKYLYLKGEFDLGNKNVEFFLSGDYKNKESSLITKIFAQLDDIDIMAIIKKASQHSDKIVQLLSQRILDRKLFKIKIQKNKLDSDFLNILRQDLCKQYNIDEQDAHYLLVTGKETNTTYERSQSGLKILNKNGLIKPFVKCSNLILDSIKDEKYYYCHIK